ncbi:MAG: hypothetical protein U1E56_02345 [Bauldia sp.]
MGKSYPTPPDPYRTASAQYDFARKAMEDSARLNAVNQYAPWGSTTYEYGANGVPTAQHINLGDREQQFFNTSGDVRNALGSAALGLTNYLPSGPLQRPDTYGPNSVASALYQRQLALLQPQFDEASNRAIVNLAERGIPIGSDVWNREQNRLDTQRTNALGQVANDSVLAAGRETDRQLQNEIAMRMEPFNELSALLRGAPASPTPQFLGQTDYRIAAPDYANLVENNYNQGVAATRATNDGLFGLARALIPGVGFNFTKTLA